MPTRGLQDELDRPRVTHQLDAEGGGREAACGVPAERRGRRAFLSESGNTLVLMGNHCLFFFCLFECEGGDPPTQLPTPGGWSFLFHQR